MLRQTCHTISNSSPLHAFTKRRKSDDAKRHANLGGKAENEDELAGFEPGPTLGWFGPPPASPAVFSSPPTGLTTRFYNQAYAIV